MASTALTRDIVVATATSLNFLHMRLADSSATDPSSFTAIQQRLVRRHIAYLYAVKENLRRESTKEYLRALSAEDGTRLDGLTHPANGILQLQGEDIDAA